MMNTFRLQASDFIYQLHISAHSPLSGLYLCVYAVLLSYSFKDEQSLQTSLNAQSGAAGNDTPPKAPPPNLPTTANLDEHDAKFNPTSKQCQPVIDEHLPHGAAPHHALSLTETGYSLPVGQRQLGGGGSPRMPSAHSSLTTKA